MRREATENGNEINNSAPAHDLLSGMWRRRVGKKKHEAAAARPAVAAEGIARADGRRGGCNGCRPTEARKGRKNKESVRRGKANKILDARRQRSMRKRKGHETAPDVAGDKKEKVPLNERIVAGLSWCVPVASPDKEEGPRGRRQGSLEREDPSQQTSNQTHAPELCLRENRC